VSAVKEIPSMPSWPRRGSIDIFADVFALDLHRALVEQLPEALELLSPIPLTQKNLEPLGGERGVYQLFERNASVYIGKSELPLARRLDQHRRRCVGRRNININDMAFRCLYVDRFVDAASPERILIDKYRAEGLAPWNVEEGFAPRDVGRKRDRGKPGQWFVDRPADYEAIVVVHGGERVLSLMSALHHLKDTVPFDLFRYAHPTRSRDPKDRADASDYSDRTVTLGTDPQSVIDHLKTIVAVLPVGWQATVLPHGVIVYKETHDYDYALAGWRRTETGVDALPPGTRMTHAR
jgi:hypothetical protein